MISPEEKMPPTGSSRSAAAAPPQTSSSSSGASSPDTDTVATFKNNVSDTFYHTIARIIVHEADFDFEYPFKIKGNS